MRLKTPQTEKVCCLGGLGVRDRYRQTRNWIAYRSSPQLLFWAVVKLAACVNKQDSHRAALHPGLSLSSEFTIAFPFSQGQIHHFSCRPISSDSHKSTERAREHFYVNYVNLNSLAVKDVRVAIQLSKLDGRGSRKTKKQKKQKNTTKKQVWAVILEEENCLHAVFSLINWAHAFSLKWQYGKRCTKWFTLPCSYWKQRRD